MVLSQEIRKIISFEGKSEMLFFHSLKVEDEPCTRYIIKVATFFFIIIGIRTCRCKL